MNEKQMIIDYSNTIGIDAIGFCKAYFDEKRIISIIKRKELALSCELEPHEEIKDKFNPENQLEGAKSFIVILESYLIKKKDNNQSDIPCGVISASAVFEDYHKLVTRKLKKLQEYISEQFNEKSIIYCDNSPFSDRDIAVRAGLGVIGKNSFLINKNFGTATYIGYLLTTLELDEYNKEITEDYCINCNRCIKACPNNAIIGDRQINSNLCISYLTQSKVIDKKFKKVMNNFLYGCDTCQLVCPYNEYTNNKEIKPIVEAKFPLEKLLSISNKEFKETLGQTSAGWRGKKMLQRNAIIALSNLKTDKAIELLNQYKYDNRESIRLEIAEALKNINGHFHQV